MAAARYRADAADAVLCVPLGELTALYHRPSARTHLVGSPVPEILETLGEAAMDADALMQALASRYALGDADPEALAARLGELEAVGLIRKA